MKRLISGLVGLFGFVIVSTHATPASADVIAVGDYIKFISSSGTLGGGAFSIDDTANGAGVDFLSFCLQRTQYIDYGGLFRVGGITDHADDLPTDDPISNETAWIFTSFRHGTLTGVYGVDAIQAAIWSLENEWSSDVDNSAALRAAAHAAVLGGWNNDDHEVQVLNLFYADGRRAQDQLTYTSVPEPASLALFGTGLAGLAAITRRRIRRQAAPPAA